MTRFAAETTVAVDKSRAEIERTLTRYGCEEFGYSITPEHASVGFRMKGLSIRFILPFPPRAELARTPQGKIRSDPAIGAAWDQVRRQRWRALALVVKAKLEAVESGITTLEQEFLAHVVTDTGETIGERMRPHLAQIAAGKVPLLPPPR